MIAGIINSERPEEHWKYLNCKGKIILDLGCGFWTHEERQSRNGTAKYFISQEPQKYIGVDSNGSDIKDLSLEFPQAVFIEKPIRQTEDILGLIFKYAPQTIKCDIEGMEIALFGLKEKYSIREIAIETHGSLDFNCFKWITKVGLNPYRIDDASFCPEIKIIYAKC